MFADSKLMIAGAISSVLLQTDEIATGTGVDIFRIVERFGIVGLLLLIGYMLNKGMEKMKKEYQEEEAKIRSEHRQDMLEHKKEISEVHTLYNEKMEKIYREYIEELKNGKSKP